MEGFTTCITPNFLGAGMRVKGRLQEAVSAGILKAGALLS